MLLSQALVAFTMSSTTRPNTASRTAPTGHGLPHPATAPRRVAGVASHVGELLRYVTGDPITVGDLEARARTGPTWTACAAGATSHRRHRRKAHNGRRGGMPCCADSGRPAGPEIWRPLPGFIEQRWRDRLGADQLSRCEIPHQHWSAGWIRAARLPADPRAALLSQGPTPGSAVTRRHPRRRRCRCPPCCPGSCWRSPSSTSAKPGCLAVGRTVLRVLGAERTGCATSRADVLPGVRRWAGIFDPG